MVFSILQSLPQRAKKEIKKEKKISADHTRSQGEASLKITSGRLKLGKKKISKKKIDLGNFKQEVRVRYVNQKNETDD